MSVNDVRRFPMYIISYNNLTFTSHMVNQLSKYSDNITIIDNNSTYPKLLSYYSDVYKYKLDRLSSNMGPQNFLNTSFSNMPESFVYTDPDLLLNPNLPDNFLDVMIELSEKYKVYKVGFALDISDKENFTDRKYNGMDIYTWESQFWKNKINNDNYELYSASIDTTFAIYNKKYYTGNFYDPSIRIAGNFTCKHIPWYRHHPLQPSDEELVWYKQGNNVSSWI